MSQSLCWVKYYSIYRKLQTSPNPCKLIGHIPISRVYLPNTFCMNFVITLKFNEQYKYIICYCTSFNSPTVQTGIGIDGSRYKTSESALNHRKLLSRSRFRNGVLYIINRIYKHVDNHNILADDQKRCKRNHQECKEQLFINSVILRQAQTELRNIFTAFEEYEKAFDSIPHS